MPPAARWWQDCSILPDLQVAGALRKSTRWESTAIPELREQAQAAGCIALAVLLGGQALLHFSRLEPAGAELGSLLDT